MYYIFVFLGEFGYELFNWQGLIRRFKTTIDENDKIICCSRADLSPIYDVADIFIDISELVLFKQSIAGEYFARHKSYYATTHEYDTIRDLYIEKYHKGNKIVNDVFQQEVKAEIQRYVCNILENTFRTQLKTTFVFSSDCNILNEIIFNGGNIYKGSALSQNLYKKITIDDQNIRNSIEKRMPFPLSHKYILIQSRKRDIVIRSRSTIDMERYIEKAAEMAEVICLEFSTGRNGDSYSSFDDIKNVFKMRCSSFREQAILVQHASACVFFTEGDFGSHIYVPPFLGKDVYAVAPKNIYAIGTTPLDFWNETVFRFGGKIQAYVAEDIFSSPDSLEGFAAMIDKDMAHQHYLQSVETQGTQVRFEDFYLWPRTVRAKDHQDKIRERVGVDDYAVNDPRSRSAAIIKHLKKLISQKSIPENFSLLDLCCGDAVVVSMIQKHFPSARCYGQDCLKDEFETHEMAYAIGVKLYGGFLQHVTPNDPKEKFDVVLLLNTYRGWGSADLREHERDLPMQVDAWIEKNSLFTIVTATYQQIAEKKSNGISLRIIGKGEDESHMTCFDFATVSES